MSRAATATRLRQIIRVPDGARSNCIPPEIREHRLVYNRAFFTLPQGLLTLLASELGEDSFDSEIQRLEFTLSQISGNHTQLVGFWRNAAVEYCQLRREPVPQFDEQTLQSFGWDMTVAQANSVFGSGESRSRRYFQVAQGYAGWLMTNPTFIQEHDDLLREFPGEVQDLGLPGLARPLAVGIADQFNLPRRPSSNSFFERCQAFCLRWRLSGLAAPNLPTPLQPQTPAPAPLMATGPMNHVGALFYLPDTFPVPRRDELRNMMEESLRGAESPEHLAGWMRLVRRENRSRNQIVRFGRAFELQHYCRILQERHPDAIRRRQGNLELALASFMNVSVDTVHRDLNSIRRRLGRDWMSRGNNVMANASSIRSPLRPR